VLSIVSRFASDWEWKKIIEDRSRWRKEGLNTNYGVLD
jgi:hypothetical protein